jgi:hypothetical protein
MDTILIPFFLRLVRADSIAPNNRGLRAGDVWVLGSIPTTPRVGRRENNQRQRQRTRKALATTCQGKRLPRQKSASQKDVTAGCQKRHEQAPGGEELFATEEHHNLFFAMASIVFRPSASRRILASMAGQECVFKVCYAAWKPPSVKIGKCVI